ncbi:MAG TPA: hypothetical protein VNG69_14815 [Casimicrobiaceae bacterium]|nr:hypothetical protein [Casimicrobiaceae bacterium]
MLDTPALGRYLAAHVEGFREPLVIEPLQGGQSNPTFKLTTPGSTYVLRKKPVGELLRSARHRARLSRDERVARQRRAGAAAATFASTT